MPKCGLSMHYSTQVSLTVHSAMITNKSKMHSILERFMLNSSACFCIFMIENCIRSISVYANPAGTVEMLKCEILWFLPGCKLTFIVLAKWYVRDERSMRPPVHIYACICVCQCMVSRMFRTKPTITIVHEATHTQIKQQKYCHRRHLNMGKQKTTRKHAIPASSQCCACMWVVCVWVHCKWTWNARQETSTTDCANDLWKVTSWPICNSTLFRDHVWRRRPMVLVTQE